MRHELAQGLLLPASGKQPWRGASRSMRVIAAEPRRYPRGRLRRAYGFRAHRAACVCVAQEHPCSLHDGASVVEGVLMENAPTRVALQVDASRRAPASSHRSREIPLPVAEGLDCLRESAVPYTLLHADLVGLETLPYLDLHIDPSEHRIAFAALRRAGFREMRPGLRFAEARVFLRFENERFFALVVRSEFIQSGVRYMGCAARAQPHRYERPASTFEPGRPLPARASVQSARRT